MAIDPLQLLGALGNGPPGVEVRGGPQPPRRLFFHTHAHLMWADESGLPPGVEITNQQTGEKVQTTVLVVGLFEEDGRSVTHIVYLDEEGMERTLGQAAEVLTDEMLTKLGEIVSAESAKRLEP